MQKHLVKLQFDGLFGSGNGLEEFKINTQSPPRFEKSHAQQVWIHESSINSLLLHYNEQYFPYLVQGTQTDTILHREFS